MAVDAGTPSSAAPHSTLANTAEQSESAALPGICGDHDPYVSVQCPAPRLYIFWAILHEPAECARPGLRPSPSKCVPKLPARATKYAVAYDLYQPFEEGVYLAPHSTVKINCGVQLRMAKHYYCQLFDRSSLAIAGITLSGGVLDSDYMGDVCVVLTNGRDEVAHLPYGLAIANMVVLPVVASELREWTQRDTRPIATEPGFEHLQPTSEARGDQGFGSTTPHKVRVTFAPLTQFASTVQSSSSANGNGTPSTEQLHKSILSKNTNSSSMYAKEGASLSGGMAPSKVPLKVGWSTELVQPGNTTANHPLTDTGLTLSASHDTAMKRKRDCRKRRASDASSSGTITVGAQPQHDSQYPLVTQNQEEYFRTYNTNYEADTTTTNSNNTKYKTLYTRE